MTDTTTAWPTQITLPGQAAAPTGPLDMWMMYVTHHAYRRDLTTFLSAAERTPLDARQTWRAMAARWDLFALALHHHHSAEDQGLWPLLSQRADAVGQRMLAAMEAEHAEIDPTLDAVRGGLGTMSHRGDGDVRSALVVRLAAARESLGRHLAHEETEAIALMQQVMTEAEWQQVVADFFKPKKVTWTELVNVLPWTTDGVPPEVRRRLLADIPGGRLIFALSRPGYQRRERIAFRYAAT